ncbi:serine protein kinase RIO [Candidatus Woesearchaeota archaeon]|nr:serine protein kinase RIO [Candidatus Woesearchaeota archaeon]
MAINPSREEWKTYKNVFSKFSIRLLDKLISEDVFKGLESPINIGKEANIFTALTKKNKRVVVKIYRLESCNFNKMYEYIVQDTRYSNIKKNKRNIVFKWTQREYKNLMKAREVIKVPTPLAVKENILVMEFIGTKEPAPMLKDKEPKNPEKFFNDIIENMRKLYKTGIIHGDLSKFNILNHNEKPVFIDFSQATLKESFNAEYLLKRDIKNVSGYFSGFFEINEENILKKIKGS